MTLLHEPVLAAGDRAPDAPAVRGPDGAFTYRELNAWSNRIARALEQRGVRQGDRVALWGEKSCRLVAAMQGTLRLGAAYVPIAASVPAARALAIIRDCGVRGLVTDAARSRSLAGDEAARACLLVDDWGPVEAQSADPVRTPAAAPDDLAYILYTSGSTGRPKGVCISHRNAMAFIQWAADAAHVTERSRLTNHASFTFDLSVFDLYAAFLGRACVTLISETTAVSGQALVDLLRQERITIWYSVPSALVLMIEQGGLLDLPDPSLDTVIFAGEVFPLRHLRRLRQAWPGVRLLNFYGPTETNVCTSFEVGSIAPERTTPIPIGRASCGNRVWLGDADGHPIPGPEGELFVGGPTVMLGYWGGEPQGDRPYATGDICRVEPDGTFVYVGRKDHMVKIRGHRIEPGDVEAVLATYPGFVESAVVAIGEGIDARLVGFYVTERAARPTLMQLKAHCATHLPPYMVISLAWPLPALPRTANGKVDRRCLADMAMASVQASSSARA